MGCVTAAVRPEVTCDTMLGCDSTAERARKTWRDHPRLDTVGRSSKIGARAAFSGRTGLRSLRRTDYVDCAPRCAFTTTADNSTVDAAQSDV